jgi:hypothetical protein
VFGEVMLGRHNVLEQSLFDRTPQPTKRNVWSDLTKMWRPEVTISIIDRDLLRKYYEKAFQNHQLDIGFREGPTVRLLQVLKCLLIVFP